MSRRLGRDEEDTGGQTHGDGRGPDFGGEHSGEYTDVRLESCTPEIYLMNIITNVTP